MSNYEKQPTRVCNHPELLPRDWDQKRPEICEMMRLCDCGENQCCPVCGWGFGNLPCRCHPQVHIKARQNNIQ
jgi:hypothetical protein